jgi:hypothetical protein
LNNEKESFCQLFDQTGRVSKSSKVLISPSVSSCSGERKQTAPAGWLAAIFLLDLFKYYVDFFYFIS